KHDTAVIVTDGSQLLDEKLFDTRNDSQRTLRVTHTTGTTKSVCQRNKGSNENSSCSLYCTGRSKLETLIRNCKLRVLMHKRPGIVHAVICYSSFSIVPGRDNKLTDFIRQHAASLTRSWNAGIGWKGRTGYTEFADSSSILPW
ncbi:hypothetical protein M514_11172, partial [Trichuris suis]